MMKNRVFVFGSYNVDMVSVVKEFPLPGQSIKAKQFSLGSGGKGANQAFAAKQNGADVSFLTKIGTDEFAPFARAQLSERGFCHSHVIESDQHGTGIANIFVRESDKENMIAINLGANSSVSLEEVRRYEGEIAHSKVLVVQLENNCDAVLEALTLARQHGVTTILNPAPYSGSATAMLPFTDIITPNETEAMQLTGLPIHSLEDAKRAAETLKQMADIKVVILTLGSKGALCFDGKTHHLLEGVEAKVVDTTGAGDAFNGALAAQLADGVALHQAVRYATAYASLAVERRGASNMPDGTLVPQRLSAMA